MRSAILPSLLFSLCLVLGVAAGNPASALDEEKKEFLKAEALVEMGDYKSAIPILERIVERDPKQATAYDYLGLSYANLGQLEKAHGYYQQALVIDNGHRGANLHIGQLYLQTDNLPQAEARLDALDKACLLGCEEYTALKVQIQSYKTKKGM